jgi:urea transport system permease protein
MTGVWRPWAALVAVLLLVAAGPTGAGAETPPSTAAGADAGAEPPPTAIEEILRANADLIAKSSRQTVEPAITALATSGLDEAAIVLERWRDRKLWVRKADGRFFLADTTDRNTYTLGHVVTGLPVGSALRSEIDEVKPNSGVQALINSALVAFNLGGADAARRQASLDAILRSPSAEHLGPLRAALGRTDDPVFEAALERAERLLTLRFDTDEAARIAAIESFGGDLSVDARAALNPLLATDRTVRAGGPAAGENVARVLRVGDGIAFADAWAMLVAAKLAPAAIDAAARDAALVGHIADGRVAGVPVAALSSRAARDDAYERLAEAGLVPPTLTEDERQEMLSGYVFYDVYRQPKAITDAARAAIDAIDINVALYRALDLALDALSLASIYFLAAIGLAITFGVMGVINMAHGEFIMMGAYTGYVVQQFVPDYTLSLALALPLAFLVTFAAGVVLERLVIRFLYHRPLETLLATFGVSIALQQLFKNIFGTQARPLTAPDWLGGNLVINDVAAISTIRVAIFVLALVFFVVLLLVLNRTRLGLEVRAVTQNPKMASSMGINPGRINMLTFGLGSGIAGIAGVAIGLFAKVTSDLGQQYIVQSFMTVVVGGVGNIWGTLAGATLIGFLQKGIEFFNPSNTLAAATYMIIFIIAFIQFRPKGIFALRGRAAEA